MNNKYYTVCGAVFIGEKLLLVRHTYGTAKDRILLPGGFVKESELPTDAAVREIFEETSVRTAVQSLICVQFKPNQWCAVFLMKHIGGEPKSDGFENSEVLLLTPDEALQRDDLTNMSRAIISAIKNGERGSLEKGSYVPASADPREYAIFGV